ncbi:hypothetical protein N0V91_000809 [Didymella pomorum]|uniref:Uncharacterized protein n=1 Tax=Didymella pomorum TaxID=749634 RepID=A0A9W9DBM0_9PLEO|nr:hypothetical protein N0V91_000809 [Didymella pomorum]
MESSEGQLALIEVWAEGTDFNVDSNMSPKANFGGLAKAKGWVGGDADWRSYWQHCFKEPYPFGRRDVSTTPAAPKVTHDLVIRSRRRLSNSSDNSVASAGSDYSVINGPSSVQSLDTNGSIAGGVLLELMKPSLEPTQKEAPTTTSETQLSNALDSLDLSVDSMAGAHAGTTDDPKSSLKASDFWYQYPGFEPNPRAPFKHEFSRLCKHVGAQSKKEKNNLQTEALTAEIKHHYGANLSRLDRWQELCEEIGIEKIPTSVSQCQKVLRGVFVNLFNVVDHRRNPELKILRFQTRGEFNAYTRKGHEFPRNCAKQEGFIKALLKKM